MRAVFGNPWSKKSSRQNAVINSAMDIIEQTPKGETLLVSIFNMTYPGFDDTLIRAHRRGVHVKVLVNHEKAGRTRYDALKRELGLDTDEDSSFVVRGGNVRMHSKFLLASRSDGRDHVVWMSSGNMTKASGRNQANEALEITGDKKLYDFFSEQFALMSQGVKNPRKLARAATTPTAVVQAYPLPKGGRANDPVSSLLDDVTCRVAGKTTTIRMAQLYLSADRGYLAEKLRDLKADGCKVRIVGFLRIWGSVPKQLVRSGPGQIDLRGSDEKALHTKITTIEGWNAAGEPIKLAMAGSHNLTGRALTRTGGGVNDEFSIIVTDPDTVDDYSRFVDWVFEKHSTPVS